MNGAFVAVRALHFAAAMLAFGELVFAVTVAGTPWRRAVAASPQRRGGLARHVAVVTAFALVVSALSGAAWLVIEAGDMSGTALGRGLGVATFFTVLGQTAFGHVFIARAVLLAMLVVALAALSRATDDAASRRRTSVALIVAASYLATLAGAGHAAAAADGAVRIVHVGADALHLLAAGGWLGALPALVRCLAVSPSHSTTARLARRFSVLGIVCVGVLIASGIVNSLYLVGSFAALFGTPYGKLLVVKLALFAALLAIAAINRWRLTPHLADDDATARAALRRNAMVEIAGGIGIVTIVGALGTMVPGAHQSPVWPFDFALDFSAASLAESGNYLVAILLGVVAAVAVIITGVRRRAVHMRIGGSVALLGLAAASTALFAVPAFPTTYATSPVPYSADAVARGATRFAQDCASCHGADARGSGPAAAALAVKPPNLAEHALHHRPGNLFWWIAHGIPGTPMPAFSPRHSDRDIWELVQFLIARASAQSATSIGADVASRSMSRAPDFSYELPGQGQRTLSGERTPALIVLYSSESAARLAELASDHRLLHATLRVIAMPLPGTQASDGGNPLTRAIVNPDVPAVYATFAATAEHAHPMHAELLVDANGIVRARWIGVPVKDADRDAAIAAALAHLPAPARMPPMHHGH